MSNLDLYYDLLEVAIEQKDVSCLIEDSVQLCWQNSSNMKILIDKLPALIFEVKHSSRLLWEITELLKDKQFFKSLSEEKVKEIISWKIKNSHVSFGEMVLYSSFNNPQNLSFLDDINPKILTKFITSHNELGVLTQSQLDIIRDYDVIPYFKNFNPVILGLKSLRVDKLKNFFQDPPQKNKKFVILKSRYNGHNTLYLNENCYQDKLFIWGFGKIKFLKQYFQDKKFKRIEGFIYEVILFETHYEESLNLLKPYLIKDLINIIKDYVF